MDAVLDLSERIDGPQLLANRAAAALAGLDGVAAADLVIGTSQREYSVGIGDAAVFARLGLSSKPAVILGPGALGSRVLYSVRDAALWIEEGSAAPQAQCARRARRALEQLPLDRVGARARLGSRAARGARRRARAACAAAACPRAHSRERAWRQEWAARMQCWWEETPYRAALQSCMHALSVILADRLDRAGGSATTARDTRRPEVAAEDGCAWLPNLADKLALPGFPLWAGEGQNGFEFSVPPLPVELLPWGYQRWLEMEEEQVEEHAEAEDSSSLQLAVAVMGGAAAGALAAAAVSFLLPLNSWRQGQGNRLALRPRSGRAAHTPAHTPTATLA